MPAQYVTSIVEGQDFYVADIDPTGVVSAPRGSVCLRVDLGNTLIYLNTSAGAAPGIGTTWVAVLSTDLTDISQLLLKDNSNPALDIGSTGLLDLVRFITTNGAEQLIYNGPASFKVTGNAGIEVTAPGSRILAPANSIDVGATALSQAAGGTGGGALVSVTLNYAANATGGPVPTTFALANTRTLQLIDAYALGTGGASNVQVTTTAPAPVSSAMAPGGANAIARTTTLQNRTFAPLSSIVLTTQTGGAAGQVCITFVVA